MSTEKKQTNSLGNLKVHTQAQRIYILKLVGEVLEPLAGLISESLLWCQVITMGQVVVFFKWLGLNKKDHKACKEIGKNGPKEQNNIPEIKPKETQNELKENKDN